MTDTNYNENDEWIDLRSTSTAEAPTQHSWFNSLVAGLDNVAKPRERLNALLGTSKSLSEEIDAFVMSPASSQWS